MVSVASSPRELHHLAHQAALRGRDSADSGESPIEDALAAVAALRHPPSYRHRADAALDRLMAWKQDGGPQRTSDDAVALVVGAWAAKCLARPDQELYQAAVNSVIDIAGRDPVAFPELHVALAVWGLDELQPDRALDPWPQLRARLEKTEPWGVDAALHAYSTEVAARESSPRRLVKALLHTAPSSPPMHDASVVAWVITAAIERVAPHLGADEPGLVALIDRRTELAQRLHLELTLESFDVFSDDAGDEAELVPEASLSSMEAVLLDAVLASRQSDPSWLTFEEAREFFGTDAEQHYSGRLFWQRTTALVLLFLGVVVGALVAWVLVLSDVEGSVAAAFALMGAAAMGLAGLVVSRSAWKHRRMVSSAAGLLVALCLVAFLLLLDHVLPADVSATVRWIVSVLIPPVGAIVGGLLIGKDDR